MNDADFGHSDVDTEFGRELLASVREALAHKRGEIELPYREYPTPMPATRVKESARRSPIAPRSSNAASTSPPAPWKAGNRATAPQTSRRACC